MTKKDIKDGMYVETRNGNKYLVCGGNLIRKEGYCPLDVYTNDLLVEGKEPTTLKKGASSESQLDIVKVYDENFVIDFDNLNLIWEREEDHPIKVGDIFYANENEDFIVMVYRIDENRGVYYVIEAWNDDDESLSVMSKDEFSHYTFIDNYPIFSSSLVAIINAIRGYKHKNEQI